MQLHAMLMPGNIWNSPRACRVPCIVRAHTLFCLCPLPSTRVVPDSVGMQGTASKLGKFPQLLLIPSLRASSFRM